MNLKYFVNVLDLIASEKKKLTIKKESAKKEEVVKVDSTSIKEPIKKIEKDVKVDSTPTKEPMKKTEKLKKAEKKKSVMLM